MKDYYKVLSVAKDASMSDIKKSFRKLAQQYHPDKNIDNPETDEKFKEVNEAYQILSDDKQRLEYDAIRSGGSRNRDPFNFGFGDGLDDIFGSFFSGGFSHRNSRRPDTKTSKSIRFDISLDDLRSGKISRIFKINTNIDCDSCNGIGGRSRSECIRCNGSGKIIQSYRQGPAIFHTSTSCEACYGSGTVVVDPCMSCGGSGLTPKEEVFDLDITCKVR